MVSMTRTQGPRVPEGDGGARAGSGHRRLRVRPAALPLSPRAAGSGSWAEASFGGAGFSWGEAARLRGPSGSCQEGWPGLPRCRALGKHPPTEHSSRPCHVVTPSQRRPSSEGERARQRVGTGARQPDTGTPCFLLPQEGQAARGCCHWAQSVPRLPFQARPRAAGEGSGAPLSARPPCPHLALPRLSPGSLFGLWLLLDLQPGVGRSVGSTRRQGGQPAPCQPGSSPHPCPFLLGRGEAGRTRPGAVLRGEWQRVCLGQEGCSVNAAVLWSLRARQPLTPSPCSWRS